MVAEAPLFPFDNSYARLPERFYGRVSPTSVADPALIRVNGPLARHLGVDPERLATPEAIQVLAGNRVPESAQPLAMAYAGFQFGNWVPQLGDGRAILLGEVVDRDGVRRDVQLKGAGRTPFSRNGDGRAGLGPVLREYIVSEAMAALGVATTRALAAVTTGERIRRETALPGAVLTRVAQSHIRVGTFQFFAGRRDVEALRLLTEHVIERHYPEAAEAENPPLAMLEAVLERQAELIAQWHLLGFIHGVMNTDNMSVAGETIDYGPCAFMDSYHPDTVYSSIDRNGRYAFGNQPSIAYWNLSGLANTLLPLIADDPDEAVEPATEVLQTFPDRFTRFHRAGLRRKFGLHGAHEGDAELVQDLLTRMADNGADFTLLHPHVPRAEPPRGSALGSRRLRARALQRALGVRRLGRALATSPCQRVALIRRAAAGHAVRQPSVHPSQSSRGRGYQRRRRWGRLRPVRKARRRARLALPRPACERTLRGAPSTRRGRPPDILRNLIAPADWTHA